MPASVWFWLLLLGLVPANLPTITVHAQEKAGKKASSRAEQAAEIEKQIADLTKRLETLKAPAPPVTTKSVPVEPSLPANWTRALSWRGIGPASMGGRIVAFSVFESDPSTYWIATASGGLLKTMNNGVTFEHQFDREATVSIGDVCVAPSDRNVVWVGTGEHNPRNSVSYGDGVYKSTDGGKSWKNMGLKKSFQIGRIVVHPKDPNTVYVGALGRLYGPNEERGLYKTTDGGTTWTKIWYLDDKTGVIELQMHPKDPETLLVATWERQRDGFDSHAGALAAQFSPNAKVDPPLSDGYDAYDPIKKWGPGSGIFKTTDGGKTFRKLTKGLPTGNLGRIGIDYYRKDPNIVYAIVDSDKIGMGTLPGYLGVTSEQGSGGVRIADVTEGSPAERAGLLSGDIVTAANKTPIKVPSELSEAIGKSRPGDKLTLTVLRGKETKTIEVTLGSRNNLFAGAGPGAVGGSGGGGGRRGGAGGVDFKGEGTDAGVRVLAVQPQGASARAGLLEGDIIVTVDKLKVTTVPQIAAALRSGTPGGKLVINVKRGKESKDLAFVVPPRVARAPVTRPFGFFYGGQRENVQTQQGPDSYQYGGLYRSSDGGESWVRVNSVNPRPMYFSQVRVDPSDDRFIYVLGVSLYRSNNAGKTFEMSGDRGVHPDHHAMWINPRDGRHILIGTDGGSYVSYDRCAHWDFLNSMAIGQFYSSRAGQPPAIPRLRRLAGQRLLGRP